MTKWTAQKQTHGTLQKHEAYKDATHNQKKIFLFIFNYF